MFSLGTVPFSASSSWNTPIGTGATYTKLNWPASTGYNYSASWETYSPAVYVASSSDPVVKVSYPAGWGYPGGTISVHMPAAADGAAGTDGELVVIDGDNVYNFWQFNRTGTNSATAASMGYENAVTGDGWGSKSPFLSAGITAAGASEFAGLLVEAETDKGAINHALQLVVDSTLVKSGFTGDAINGDGGSSSGIVKEGDHLGIPLGTPMPSGLSPLGQQVFTAMQQYGAYVIDVAGGTTNIRAQSNAYDSATMTALWHDMSKITPLLQGVTGGSGTLPGGTTGSGTSGGTGASGGSTGTTGGTGTSGGVVTNPVPPDGGTSGGTTTGGTTGGVVTDPVTSGGGTSTSGGATGGASSGGSTSGGRTWHGYRHGQRDYAAAGDATSGGRTWQRHYGGQRDYAVGGADAASPRAAAWASSLAGRGLDIASIASGGDRTLGYSGDFRCGTPLSGDGVLAAKTALMSQFAAASFAAPGAAFGGTAIQDRTSTNLAQTLTQPRA